MTYALVSLIIVCLGLLALIVDAIYRINNQGGK